MNHCFTALFVFQILKLNYSLQIAQEWGPQKVDPVLDIELCQ